MIRVTEFSFLEQFASRYGIPVPRHIEGNARHADLKQALDDWGGQAIVKPDVLTGKRGKAGAIVTVTDLQEAIREVKRISSTEINGKMPRTAYLVENIPAQMEMFTAITYNSSYLQPSFTVSLNGGVDIEDVPEDQKVTIPVDIFQGFDAYQASEILNQLGCKQELISVLSRAMVSFWDLFKTTGMITVEINPWRTQSFGQGGISKKNIDRRNSGGWT